MNDLSIIRNELRFETQFTQIPNEWVRDSRLGFKAKGVLLYLLSHKSGWKTSIEHLASVAHDGRDSIRTAIKELEDCGYLVRIRHREAGKLAHAEWHLKDPFAVESESEKPTVEKPMLENPTQENPTLKNTNIKNTNNKKTNDISSNKTFEIFWTTYPRKTAKGQARIAYQKALSKASDSEIQDAVERFAGDPNLPDPQFIPHASTWLNQERWTDGVLPKLVRKPVGSENAQSILQRANELQHKMQGRAKEIGY